MAGESVELTVYGEASANDQDIVKPSGPFPLTEALAAARAMWNLADAVADSRRNINTAAADAVVDWRGPHKDDVFDPKVESYGTSATSMENALRELARGLGQAWASARGQQNRINFARHVEHELANQGGWRSVPGVSHVGEFFAGEEDFGPEPDNPSASGPDGFPETGEAMYTDFGP